MKNCPYCEQPARYIPDNGDGYGDLISCPDCGLIDN